MFKFSIVLYNTIIFLGHEYLVYMNILRHISGKKIRFNVIMIPLKRVNVMRDTIIYCSTCPIQDVHSGFCCCSTSEVLMPNLYCLQENWKQAIWSQHGWCSINSWCIWTSDWNGKNIKPRASVRHLSSASFSFFLLISPTFCCIFHLISILVCYRYTDDKIRITRGYRKIIFVHLRVNSS